MRRHILILIPAMLVANLAVAADRPDPVIAPAATIPATTVPPTTTTLPAHRPLMEAGQPPVPTTVPLGFSPVCGEPLMRLAVEVGWPVEELPMLDRVARRESGADCGNTDRNLSHNQADPMGGSRGTMQINGYWCTPVRYNPAVGGWLGEHGVLDDCADLFNTTINLKAALLIWQRSGWGPWGS